MSTQTAETDIRERLVDIATRTRSDFMLAAAPMLLKWQFDSDLRGACGIASWLLARDLRDAGFEAEIAGHEEHVWVECSGFVVDITASQFGLSPVLVFARSTQPPDTWSFSYIGRAIFKMFSLFENTDHRARARLARRVRKLRGAR